MRVSAIRPEYVERIPKVLDEGVFYISEKYATAAHNCCCGCGSKVVTPLKPGRWSIKTKGGRISITPSIGNWSLACQSHYWIENNAIRWSVQFSESQIRANRTSDKKALEIAHAQRQKSERGQSKVRSWFRRALDSIKRWL